MLFSEIEPFWTIRLADVITVLALLLGPIFAVQITEYLRKNEDKKNRKFKIFKTLMATRASIMAYQHIEALNLIEVEFDSVNANEKNVIDKWKIYLIHLNDQELPKKNLDAWSEKGRGLLHDLLYEMSKSLGYSHGKAEIQSGAYYPVGYANADLENQQTRQLWLEILKGEKKLQMRAEVYAEKNAAQSPQPPHKSQHPTTGKIFGDD